MKKNLTPFLVVLILLLVGGLTIVFLRGNEDNWICQNNQWVKHGNPKTEKPQTACGQKEQEKNGNNIFSSIQDAIKKSIAIECTYVTKKGDRSKVLIKGENIRSSFESGSKVDQPGNMIVKDKKMYIWSEKTKEGMVIELKNSTNPDKYTMEKADISNREELIKSLEEVKNQCKQTVISDSVFNPPSDIKFIDLSKFTQTIGDQMKNQPTVFIPSQSPDEEE